MGLPSATQNLIGIVAGEASGDTLGASLIKALKKRYPDYRFVGIGGDKMIAEGFESLFPQDRLAVMGLVEPLKRLPELLNIRKSLKQYFVSNPPKVFIGIDSPDFNLDLEKYLRENEIRTAHYVSPSVWAWRQKRIKKIAKAVDLMLCLFPFETPIYKKNNIPVVCVGHSLADDIPLSPDPNEARQKLLPDNEAADRRLIALLPGSRSGEVARLGQVFIQAAKLSLATHPDLFFLIPAANASRREQIEKFLEEDRALPVKVFDGQSLDVMNASEIVLMASGTTTLEAMLLKKPMIIAYKMAGFSYWLLSKLVKIKNVGLPNLLAGRRVVPELLQNEATAEAISAELNTYLSNPERMGELQELFLNLHKDLRRDASKLAAQAIENLIEGKELHG